MDDLIKQYDIIWENYTQEQRKYFSEKWDFPLEYIKNNIWNLDWKKILDLGCGDGHDIAYFETRYDADFLWIDSSEYMIGQAKNNVKNSKNLYLWNFENMPFEDGFFDVIYAKYSFSYLSDFELIYKEVSRVLKKWWLFLCIQNHPLNDFLKKEQKLYFQKQKLTVWLFSGVNITYFTHIFSEIISPTFLKNFNLLDFHEDFRWENINPRYIAIKSIKL